MNDAAAIAWAQYMGMDVEMVKNSFRPVFTCHDESQPKTRHCLDCDCSQYTGLFVPCWNCGSLRSTTSDRNWNTPSWDNAHSYYHHAKEDA